MQNFKLNEAFAYAKEKGNKIMKRDLAQALWKKSRLKTALANLSNLCNGKTKKVDIEAVPTICATLGVSSDFLFGISLYPTKEAEIQGLRERLASMAMLLEEIKQLV